MLFLPKFQKMKKWIPFIFCLIAVVSCNRASDPLFGTWQVNKVHVGFDEKSTTPDMVKQIGEMEKQNRLSINSDSTMTLAGIGYTLEGRIKLFPDGKLFCNEELFGIWDDGKITTKSPSPFGEITVEYTKE